MLNSEHRIAIAISGAVSLGSYEAGVMHSLVQAFAKHNRTTPTQPVKIDVLTGSSAGGMTAALLAQKLLYESDNFASREQDAGYLAWVKMADIDGLLTFDDSDNPNAGFLSSSSIQRIADHTLLTRYQAAEPAAPKTHCAAAEQISLGLAMSNLNGIDYSVDTNRLTNGKLITGNFTQTRYQDQFTQVLDANSDNRQHWDRIATAARGCGAFPIAFAPVPLTRSSNEPDYRWQPVGSFQDKRFYYMDGGAFNNYPLGMAKELVKARPELAAHSRHYIYISPTPRNSTASHDFDPLAQGSNLLTTALHMLNSVYLQSGFQEWLMFAHEQATSGASVYSVNASANDLAGEKLQAFLGFFSEQARHHDFVVGQIKGLELVRELTNNTEDALSLAGNQDVEAQIAQLQHELAQLDYRSFDISDVPRDKRKRLLNHFGERIKLLMKASQLSWAARNLGWSWVIKPRLSRWLKL